MHTNVSLQTESLLDQAATILSSEYIPPKLIGRDKQLGILIQETQKPPNFFIEGETSVGKTATISKAIEHLKLKKHHLCVYVKCERSFMFPFRAAVEKATGELTFRQRPIKELFDRAKEREYRFVHIYLDDAHMLAKFEEKAGTMTEIVRNLYEGAKAVGAGVVRLQMVFVGTTPYINYNRFLSMMHTDAKTRGQFLLLKFGEYKPEEMVNIYTDRLSLLPIKVNPEAVQWAVATVASNAGELPMGFNLLFRGVEEMVHDHAPTLEREHLQKAFPKVKVNYWQEELSEKDEHSLLLLEAATTLAYKLKPDNASPDAPDHHVELTGHTIAVEYEQLCVKHKLKPLYPQRRNYLLKKLSIEGYFRKVGLDEKTFTVKYRYELNPATINETLREMRRA